MKILQRIKVPKLFHCILYKIKENVLSLLPTLTLSNCPNLIHSACTKIKPHCLSPSKILLYCTQGSSKMYNCCIYIGVSLLYTIWLYTVVFKGDISG